MPHSLNAMRVSNYRYSRSFPRVLPLSDQNLPAQPSSIDTHLHHLHTYHRQWLKVLEVDSDEDEETGDDEVPDEDPRRTRRRSGALTKWS